MAVQYDKENGWSSWLSLFKQDAIQISKEVEELFKKIKVPSLNDSKNSWNDFLYDLDNDVFYEFIDDTTIAGKHFEEFVNSMKGSKFTMEDYQKWLIDTGKVTTQFGSITNKVGNILKSFGASLASMAINMVIGMIIQGLSDLARASEIAREKSAELTGVWKDESSSIDESISKYDELKKKIDSGTLSTEEITTAKNELSNIEDTLVEKYGTEALGIDLVNGKYEEQLKTLKELSKEKANQYVIENRGNIQHDRKYLEEDVTRRSQVFKYDGVNSTLDSALGFDLSSILENYSNITAVSSESSIRKGYKFFLQGTREDTYNQLKALYNELEDKYGSENENVNKVLDEISALLNSSDYNKEEIDATKERIKTYAEADILDDSDTRQLYEDAIDAVEQYNEALESGEGFDEAKANLDSVKSSVDNSLGDGVLQEVSGAKDVFDDIWNSISEGASNTSDSLDDFANKTEISKRNVEH